MRTHPAMRPTCRWPRNPHGLSVPAGAACRDHSKPRRAIDHANATGFDPVAFAWLFQCL